MIGKLRGGFRQSLQGRVLGIQDAKRVAVQAATAVLVQRRRVFGELGHQSGAMGRTLGGLPQAVQFEAHVFTYP
jgi:hypothetical protein